MGHDEMDYGVYQNKPRWVGNTEVRKGIRNRSRIRRLEQKQTFWKETET